MMSSSMSDESSASRHRRAGPGYAEKSQAMPRGVSRRNAVESIGAGAQVAARIAAMRVCARPSAPVTCGKSPGTSGRTAMSHDHHHDHQGSPLPEMDLRVRALESLLVEKGYVDPNALDILIDTYEHKVGPAQRRARRCEGVVRSRLPPVAARRRHGRDRLARLHGPAGRAHGGARKHARSAQHGRLHAVFVLSVAGAGGLPPAWYKSAPYRSRAVIDPRGVLREFGVELPPEVELRVWDSTAEVRYLVLPMRPAGTGHMDESALAELGHARFDDRHGPAANAGRNEPGADMNGAHDLGGMQGVRADRGRKPTICRCTTSWERRMLSP